MGNQKPVETRREALVKARQPKHIPRLQGRGGPILETDNREIDTRVADRIKQIQKSLHVDTERLKKKNKVAIPVNEHLRVLEILAEYDIRAGEMFAATVNSHEVETDPESTSEQRAAAKKRLEDAMKHLKDITRVSCNSFRHLGD